MCNLCSSKLFIVPNPCCCCNLRCGVIWLGAFDVIIALISLYYPTTLSTDEEDELARPNEQIEPDSVPVFEVEVPWSKSPSFKSFQKTGCYSIQVVTGILILIAANSLGGRNFTKFLLGCCWLICRVLTFFTLLELATQLRQSNHGPLLRYSTYLVFKLIIDIYFFIVVRYYTMECYDAYRYEKLIHTILIRREPPVTSKAAPRSIVKEKEEIRKKRKTQSLELEKTNKRKSRAVVAIRNLLMERPNKSNYRDVEAVPVWDRKNEVIFYGEDYTDWDPVIFQTKWDILDESRKNNKTARRSRYSDIAGVALALLKAREQGIIPEETTTTPARKSRMDGQRKTAVKVTPSVISKNKSRASSTRSRSIHSRPPFKI